VVTFARLRLRYCTGPRLTLLQSSWRTPSSLIYTDWLAGKPADVRYFGIFTVGVH
jgi:hypothetical protein